MGLDKLSSGWQRIIPPISGKKKRGERKGGKEIFKKEREENARTPLTYEARTAKPGVPAHALCNKEKKTEERGKYSKKEEKKKRRGGRDRLI